MSVTSSLQAPRGGGGDTHMKGAAMLIVSLRGENFGFWSQLGCPGQYAIIFSRKDLFCTRRSVKMYILSIRFIYLIHVIKVFYDINT